MCKHSSLTKPHVQKDLTITVWSRSTGYFCLIFENSVDFWEMVRVTAEAYGIDATREDDVKELLKKAITSIPTIGDLPNGMPM